MPVMMGTRSLSSSLSTICVGHLRFQLVILDENLYGMPPSLPPLRSTSSMNASR